jgi:DNA-binding beta-propeller fold protein YncE
MAIGPVLLLGLLLAQPVTAVSYPVTIPYGRSWPLSVVVDSSRGLAYVDGMSGIYPPTGFSFGVINLTGHIVMKVLPLDEIPGALALDQSNGNVYIGGNESIQVFDAGNQSMGRRIAVGHPVRSIALDVGVSPDLFVTAGNEVYAVNPQSGRIMGNATVGNGANGMALDPSTGNLYVSEYPDSEIFVFHARDLSPVGTIRIPVCCAEQMAVDPRTHLLFATTGTRFVEAINTQSNTLLSNIPVSSSGQNSTNLVAVDNATGRVFVASSPGGSIVELDSSGGAVVGGFKVTSQVAGIAVDSQTHELYATNYHQLTVFDLTRVHVLFLLLVIGGAVAVVAVAAVLLISLRRTRQKPRL